MTAIDGDNKAIVPANMLLIYPDQIERNAETMTLRDVDKESTHFKNLVNSIKTPRVDEMGRVVADHGLLNPISVRNVPAKPGHYAITDGLHRLTAWKEAFGNSKPIPAFVLNLTDEQVLEAQIEGNALTKKTEYAEFAKQIILILDHHPERSLEEQAKRVNVEPNWLRQVLKLVSLPADIQEKVNKGTMPVSIAIPLARFKTGSKNLDHAKVWKDKQLEWSAHYEQMKDEPNAIHSWLSQVAVAIKKISKDLAEDKKDAGGSPSQFVAVFTTRPKKELEIECNRTKELFVTGPFQFVTNEEDPKHKEFAELVQGYPEFVKAITAMGYLDAMKYVGQIDEETLKNKQEAAAEKAKQKQEVAEAKKAGAKTDSVARSTGEKGGLFALFGKKSK